MSDGLEITELGKIICVIGLSVYYICTVAEKREEILIPDHCHRTQLSNH